MTVSRPRLRSQRRVRRALTGLVVAATASVALAACGSSPPAAPPASEGLILNRPTPQGITLQNQHGQNVTLASLRGKYVVLAPFLTLCQDECPLILAAFIQLKRDIAAAGLGNKVVFLEVSVDPGRDTTSRLLAYQVEFGAKWDLWTGTAANIFDFWGSFGVTYSKVPEAQPAHLDWLTNQPLTYDVEHTDGYILINPDGRERFVDTNAPFISSLSVRQASLLNAGGLDAFKHPQATDWTIDDALGAIGWLTKTSIPGAAT